MKARLHLLFVALLAGSATAAVCGCQSDPLGTNLSRADQAAFQQKVARDPFPAANGNALAGG